MSRRALLTVPVTLPARLLDELAKVASLAGVSTATVIKVALAAQMKPSAKVEGEKA